MDKGDHSVECVLLAFAMRVAFPKWFVVNRGNHEYALLNQLNGFEKELREKYNDGFMFKVSPYKL